MNGKQGGLPDLFLTLSHPVLQITERAMGMGIKKNEKLRVSEKYSCVECHANIKIVPSPASSSQSVSQLVASRRA